MPDRGADGSTASLFERLAVGTAPPVAADPVSLVIFGGTGDLARRKLLPALYNLHLDGVLPPRTAIVGTGRPAMSDDQYREFAKDGVKEFSRRPIDDAAWRQAVLKCLFTGVPLTAVDRLDERADDDLLAMVASYADERTAAGRDIPADALALLDRHPSQES